MPIVGGALGKSLDAKTGNNPIGKARRDVVGAMEQQLKEYSEEGNTDTVAEVIRAALDDLLEPVLQDEGVTLEYYEYDENEGLKPVLYDESNTNISSLMWTFNFGKSISKDLPELDFELGNSALPLQIKLVGDDAPVFEVDFKFKLGIGFDEKEGL